ncbi:MAG: hypothetical protein K8W52_25395 [Deltaproteobacteria bacterium]|nr:hypothetical protein [Deltaproteobacteria bacterium]
MNGRFWIGGLLAALAACGPAFRADGPAAHADGPVRRPVARTTAQVRGVLVGEMCPTAAAGRPGIAPLFTHDLDWSDDPDEAAEPLARGAACVAAQHGCGLAIAPVVPGRDAYSELAELPAAVTGTVCVAGDAIAVDIDGDGAVETYALGQFLDPVRAPADEITASPATVAPCKGRFAWFDARVDSGAEPGAAPDPRFAISIDIIGVVDLDGDGRRELVVAFRSPDHRSLVVYSATSTPARLERVGEAVPWDPAGN